MLANIAKVGAVSALAGGYYYLTIQKIRVNHPIIASLLQQLQLYRPQYTLPVFKILLKLNIIAMDPALKKYTLAAGFDPEGKLIEQVKGLGFAGMEVGPISYNASLEEQGESHLGILGALANICTYHSKHEKEAFKLELYIAPNYQIIKYTPYLLKENLMAALDNFLKVQQHYPLPLVQRVTIAFQRPNFSLQSETSKQVQTMIKETKAQAQLKVQSFNKEREGKVQLSFKRNQVLQWSRLLNYIINKQSL